MTFKTNDWIAGVIDENERRETKREISLFMLDYSLFTGQIALREMGPFFSN